MDKPAGISHALTEINRLLVNTEHKLNQKISNSTNQQSSQSSSQSNTN